MLGIVKIGEYTIDFSRQKILKGADVVNLSRKISGASAWKFLELLINANGRILTYEFLDESGIWRDDGGKGVDHRSSIKTWASAFNKALEGSPIKNKSGVGYYFDMKNVVKTQEALCQIVEGDILYPRTICGGVAQIDPEEAAYRLSEQIDVLVAELETIQQKIELMRELNSAVWEKIYATQFEAVYFRFRCVEAELSERRTRIDGLKKRIMAREEAMQLSSGSSRTINCESSYDITVINETQSLAENITEMQARMNALSSELDELIYEYINGSITNDELEIFLWGLPKDKKTAHILVSLTDSFDMLELYELIFTEYARFLNEAERESIRRKAMRIFDS